MNLKNTLHLLDKIDRTVEAHPLFDMIVPEGGFYEPEDFIESWDSIVTNIERLPKEEIESLSKKDRLALDKLLKIISEIEDILCQAPDEDEP